MERAVHAWPSAAGAEPGHSVRGLDGNSPLTQWSSIGVGTVNPIKICYQFNQQIILDLVGLEFREAAKLLSSMPSLRRFSKLILELLLIISFSI